MDEDLARLAALIRKVERAQLQHWHVDPADYAEIGRLCRTVWERHDDDTCGCQACRAYSFVDAREAATICGVRPATLRVWTHRGKLAVAKYAPTASYDGTGGQQTAALYSRREVETLARGGPVRPLT